MADAATLRIVNGILKTLGQATTSTLETQHPDVLQALSHLDQQDFDFQSIGWTFNTDTDISLVCGVDGTVSIPATALSFKITDCILSAMPAKEKSRYTRRGDRVYDSIAHTTNIWQTIRADLVTRLAIGDLPPVAQTYLGALCNEAANLGDDGDMAKQQKLEEYRVTAWGRLHAHELKMRALNATDSPQAQRLLLGSTGAYGGGVNPRLPGG